MFVKHWEGLSNPRDKYIIDLACCTANLLRIGRQKEEIGAPIGKKQGATLSGTLGLAHN